MTEQELSMLWSAIEKALPDDATVCRMFEAAKQGFGHLDATLECTHLRRTHLAYWWIMRLHPMFYATTIGCTTPSIVLALPSRPESRAYIDLVGGHIFDERERTIFALVEGGKFIEFSRRVGDKEVYASIETEHGSSVHVLSYADNGEDFAHRPITPIYDFGVQA